jgi:hypothetical protein
LGGKTHEENPVFLREQSVGHRHAHGADIIGAVRATGAGQQRGAEHRHGKEAE